MARYDGVGFRVWRHDPDDPASLPGNVLQVLYVDARNRIWVASEGGGVSVMDADRTGFHHFRKAQYPQMESDEVFAIAGRGDEVWFGTYGGGLYRVDAQDNVRRLRSSEPEVNAVVDRAIMALAFDDRGDVLVGTLQGLVRCVGKRVQRLALPGETPWAPVVSLWREGAATWIGTSRGLYRLHDDGRWNTPAWAAEFKGKQTVTAMADDGDGGYWIATTDGLWRVRGGTAPTAVTHETRALGVNSAGAGAAAPGRRGAVGRAAFARPRLPAFGLAAHGGARREPWPARRPVSRHRAGRARRGMAGGQHRHHRVARYHDRRRQRTARRAGGHASQRDPRGPQRQVVAGPWQRPDPDRPRQRTDAALDQRRVDRRDAAGGDQLAAARQRRQPVAGRVRRRPAAA